MVPMPPLLYGHINELVCTYEAFDNMMSFWVNLTMLTLVSIWHGGVPQR